MSNVPRNLVPTVKDRLDAERSAPARATAQTAVAPTPMSRRLERAALFSLIGAVASMTVLQAPIASTVAYVKDATTPEVTVSYVTPDAGPTKVRQAAKPAKKKARHGKARAKSPQRRDNRR